MLDNNLTDKSKADQNSVQNLNQATSTTTPGVSSLTTANKNENYDEEYNYYYDDDDENSKKTTGNKVTKKIKTTLKMSKLTSKSMSTSSMPNVRLNKQSKPSSNTTDQDNYDDEYESYDEDYYDYEEDENLASKNEKKGATKVLNKEQTKNVNATTEDEYDEYYDDAYYEEDDEQEEDVNENMNEEDYENIDKENPSKTEIAVKTNKTQGEFNKYDLTDIKILNVTTKSSSTISIMPIEKQVPKSQDAEMKTTNDDNGFYETDTEWDTNETDYYDFNFKTKANNLDTTTPNIIDQIDLSTRKATNETSFIHNFNFKDLLKSPALLAGIFGGLLLGIISTFLILIFIIYRMKRRKFEENSYMINGTLKSARVHYPNPNRIYSRNNQNQHVTLLSSSSLSPVANLSGAGSSTSTNSATTGLLNGTTTTSARLLKYTNPAQTLRKTASNLSSDSSPNHDGAFNYAYIKAPTKEFYA